MVTVVILMSGAIFISDEGSYYNKKGAIPHENDCFSQKNDGLIDDEWLWYPKGYVIPTILF